MSDHTLHLSCSCGAQLNMSTQYGETLRKERVAFDAAHGVCRAPKPGCPCQSGPRLRQVSKSHGVRPGVDQGCDNAAGG